MKKITPDISSLGLELKNWAMRLEPACFKADLEGSIQFQDWVNRLTVEDAGEIAGEMAALCSTYGFDLAWLQATLRQPDIHGSAADMLTYFCLAIFERNKNQPHLQILSWLNAPQSKSSQEFGQQLYLHLVEAGFTDLPGEFLMAAPGKRADIIARSIHHAIQQNFPLVITLTREILLLGRFTGKSTRPIGKLDV